MSAGVASLSTRDAQIRLVVNSVKPAGYTRETFQGIASADRRVRG